MAVFALASLASACLATRSPATTIGALSTSVAGPFAIAGARLYVPEFLTNNTGEAFPGPPVTEMETKLQSFSAGKHGTHTIALDVSTAGVDRPAMAASGIRVAVAWEGAHGFQSALVVGRVTPSAVVSEPASGAVAAYDVALDASGARAVAWSDDLGFRLQAISPSGLASAPATLALAPSKLFAVGSDDTGGWWVVWTASGRLVAAHAAADGVPGATVDLGAGPSAQTTPARALRPRPWTLLADGSGGLWVGLARTLLHVRRDGSVGRRALSHQATLADGDRASALAEDLGEGQVVVRSVGRLAPLSRLRHVGTPMDVAFDATRQTTYLLSATPHGRVLLTALDRRDRVTSTRALSGCPRPGRGELVASGGLVGVACAGKAFQAESVETGGDYESGRHLHYQLMSGPHVLHSVDFFEGVHDY